ncbi:stage 0 sporulation family protein [Zhouia sp. PK063]|uniref:stage 0 sporulation family protein n=1 Tax=Zhouia sp. PK063 TaxID=3373602 RepID=UPI0037888DE9
MGCTSCSTGKDGQPRGCKNNGTCGTDGCNKLTVFDWLSNMSLPGGQKPFDCVEVRFKNSRKEFFRNSEGLTLSMGDVVATEAAPGHDVGVVTLTGELVKVQMKKKGADYTDENLPKVYRKATEKDLEIWSACRNKEADVQKRSRELAIALKLQMKISDVEFQGDGSKATFYYTADDRVDFRQLIKDMARAFSIRIEMRQIGYRQEAARLGGVGSCGRELCCSTWLTDFRSVNTSAARYQQLSLNPQKLAGQCGKLKCCLNYELDAYLDALNSFPSQETKLYTEKGDATCQKIDIFKGLMWFAYVDNPVNWHKLTVDQVNEILEENQHKTKVASLEEFASELMEDTKVSFENVVGQDSLTRFDEPKHKPKNKKTRNKRKKPQKQQAEVANKSNNNPPKSQQQNSKNTGARKGRSKNNRSRNRRNNNNNNGNNNKDA